MKTLSLNIDELILVETEKIISKIKKPRDKYINEAIDFYNKFNVQKALETKINKESHLVRKESMNVLKDFETIDYAN